MKPRTPIARLLLRRWEEPCEWIPELKELCREPERERERERKIPYACKSVAPGLTMEKRKKERRRRKPLTREPSSPVFAPAYVLFLPLMARSSTSLVSIAMSVKAFFVGRERETVRERLGNVKWIFPQVNCFEVLGGCDRQGTSLSFLPPRNLEQLLS